jgi:C4-dicarboxylate transporter
LGGGAASGLVDAVGNALGGAADADEGAVVVIPVLAIFLILAAVVTGTGALAVLYFGWEALLAVAVELSFACAAANATGRLARAGWFTAALRLTWKPLLGAVLAAVLLGATLDYFVPQAHSLPEVFRQLRVR